MQTSEAADSQMLDQHILLNMKPFELHDILKPLLGMEEEMTPLIFQTDMQTTRKSTLV